MKKIILAAGILAVLTAAGAFAADLSPVDYRRTLFVPMGQDMITLEAPKGMCFLDTSKYLEGSLVKMMTELERKKGGGVLLGIFSSCDDIANIGGGDRGEGPLSLASVIWMNSPVIGGKTPLERDDFLDLMEAKYREEIEKEIAEVSKPEETLESKDPENITLREGNLGLEVKKINLEGNTFEDSIRRTQNSVSMGVSYEEDFGAEKTRAVNLSAATTIRHYPVKVTIQINTKRDPLDLAQTHELMDKFLTQQIALNE